MQLNSYGGTFIGFKAMAKQKKEIQKQKTQAHDDKPVSDGKPGKVIVEISNAERVDLPELKEGDKIELMVTAFYDEEDVTEAFTHLRQSTVPVEAKYLFDSYTCNFDQQKIVLPCVDKKQLILYVSCITSKFDENQTRNVELKGYGHTKPIPCDKCRVIPTQKEQLNAVEGNEKLEARLSYKVTITTEDDGPEIPEDRIGGLVDFYNPR